MNAARFIVRLLLPLLLLVPATLPVQAGTFAQTIRSSTLHLGPGPRYPESGEISALREVDVESCRFRWCRIDSGSLRGWMSIDDLSFGMEVRPEIFSGPKTDLVLKGSGTVCFYTGQNYTGQSHCSQTGRMIRDLALAGMDNIFRSIEITGDLSVHVCSSEHWGAYCVQVNESQPTLNQFLDREISSYRVW